jgi:AcrR family transcriptional regulator
MFTHLVEFVNQMDESSAPGTPRPPRRPHRPPPGEEPRRDPEQTRSRLLRAAKAEFAEKGLAGARVAAIAERAGVNKQLISYHFGGKDGLYRALVERWLEREQAFAAEGAPLEELVLHYLDVAVEDPELVRLFVRQMLDGLPAGASPEPTDDLDDLRRRQDEGELAPELDPGFVLLLLQGVVTAGVSAPDDVRRLLGVAPNGPDYRERMAQQLRVLVRRLRD